MAHPFSAVPLGFSVMGARTLWWGGCAWDSFALPHLLPDEDEVLVATRCPACWRPHAWNGGTDPPPDGDQVAHFLVPAARMWDDVVHTCGNQRLFCSSGCVADWLERTGSPRGRERGPAPPWGGGPPPGGGPRGRGGGPPPAGTKAAWTAATSAVNHHRRRTTCGAWVCPARSGGYEKSVIARPRIGYTIKTAPATWRSDAYQRCTPGQGHRGGHDHAGRQGAAAADGPGRAPDRCRCGLP